MAVNEAQGSLRVYRVTCCVNKSDVKWEELSFFCKQIQYKVAVQECVSGY